SLGTLTCACAASVALALPGAAAAAPLATTGGVTSLGSTSAVLNGAVSPGGLATGWFFQYGTTTSYGNNTTAAAITTQLNSVHTVQALITNLTPSTTYHYRLVAGQGYPV